MIQDSAATIQFRLDLPHTLHSISPALAALHASRAATLHPEVSAILLPSHCPKCGTYRFSGDHSTPLVGPSRKKKRRRPTYVGLSTFQRRCHRCDFSINARTDLSPSVPDLLLSISPKSGTAPITPSTKQVDQESPSAGNSNLAPTVVVPPFNPKPGRMKTPTLKDMLFRDRQREEVVKVHNKRKESEGLAAFLKQL